MELERYHDAMERVPFDPNLEQRVLSRLEEARGAYQPSRMASRPRRRVLAVALAAALCLAVTAGAYSQLSGLFAPLFSTHPEIVDQSGAPVSARDATAGYVLTANALFGDRNNLYVSMTLTREDGESIDADGLRLHLYDYDFPGSIGGAYGATVFPGQGETNSVSLAAILNSSADIPQGKTMTLAFDQLTRWTEEDEETVVAEGGWILSFPVNYTDLTRTVLLDDPVVVGDSGLCLDRIDVSPLSVRVSGESIPASQEALGGVTDAMRKGGFELTLRDGSTLDLIALDADFRHYGYSHVEDNVYKGRSGTTFSQLIPLEDMASLTVLGVEIPLEFTEE